MQIDKLTELLINDNITQDAHDRKHTQLQLSHYAITERLSEQCVDRDTLKKAMITLVSLSNKATLAIKSSKTAIKRVLLKTLFSNLELNARNVQWTMFPVFSMMQNVSEYKKWLWM